MRTLGKPLLRVCMIITIGIGAVALLQFALSLPLQAAPTRCVFPPGQTLTPLGSGQPDTIQRRNAYKALWHTLYYHRDDYPPLPWTAITATVNGTDHDPGAILAKPEGNDFFYVTSANTITVPRSLALHPRKVALYYGTVRDEYDQLVVWEEGDFEQLFRVYLWCEETPEGCPYFDTLTETQITSDLASYDILILPAIRVGYADEVAAALGAEGLQAIRDFVQGGGFLYAQSNAAYVAEQAGLVAAGTVDLSTRVTDPDNTGWLDVLLPEHPLTFSWLSKTTYVLNEPLITPTSSLSVVATFADTSQPGSVAIGVATPGDGRVVLFNGHPSDKIEYHPQVLDALLWAMGERADLHGTLCQQYSDAVGCHTVPAHEPGVPIAVTTTFKNYWDGPLSDVVITETLREDFTTTFASVVPTPTTFLANPDGTTTIVWAITETLPGDTHFTYVAYTAAPSGTAHSTLVSTAKADYVDDFWPTEYHPDGLPRHVVRNKLWVNALMAARLVGDRDIELDGLYPLPAEGEYFDIALTLENKEETTATHTIITDVVALISPIVDVDDQRLVPQVVTDTWGVSDDVSDTLWAMNEIFFYETPADIYPLPDTIDGASIITTGVFYTLTTWEAGPQLAYTYTGSFTTTPGFTNSVTIPPEYAAYITVTAEGDVVLPALRMVWDFTALPAYDYAEPAVRYGLYSHELFNRTVSFRSDPISPSLVLEGFGGTVYTNLGGHPIPFHEYLSSGVVHIPEPPEMPRVTYDDIWDRPQALELRTVFYDIVPFPPPEYHAVVNTTFEMKADRDGDGRGEERVLEFPAREGADLTLYLKSWSNFHPDMPPLERDETLLAQGMFRGRGFALEPMYETWENSWVPLHLQGLSTDTVLADVVTTPAYDYLYFQQFLASQQREGLLISATLSTYPNFHREGVIKIDEGARFVYHQKALGPSRYEVVDGHVQAVFGLSADAQVHKQVAPVLVATFDDHVYHLVQIEDPWDPRCLKWEPFIKSYGFGDLAATVYVGGRHATELLWPRVAPGGQTQIRLEIRNNQPGVTVENLTITPIAPAGITVTARSVTETQAVEPLFFDFPFLHQTVINDGWRTVWYYDVEVDAAFTDTGRTHVIAFDVTGDGLPGDFELPAAELGVGGHGWCDIRTVWGQAADLQLEDLLPPWTTPEDARLANYDEALQLEYALSVGDETSATTTFGDLRPVTFITTAVEGGTLVSFTLPTSATYDSTQMPWLENGARSGEMYVIFKSHAEIEGSGTAIINYGPAITYTDDFAQVYTDTGNLQTVEVHGATLVATYTVDAITDTTTGELVDGVVPGVLNEAAVTLDVFNQGDYIATEGTITVTFASGVTLTASTGALVAQGADWAAFDIPDLPPGGHTQVGLVLQFVPDDVGPWVITAMAPPDSYHLIAHTDGRYVHEFPFAALADRQVVVEDRLAGPLEIGVTSRAHTVYLPVVLRALVPLPDLVVRQIVVTPNDVQVVIGNIGQAPVVDDFWIDVYIDPNPIVTGVNQVWYDGRCEQGLVWGVTASQTPMNPGDTITLRIGDQYYSDYYSEFAGPMPEGTEVWAQVDAVDIETDYGGVLETHEYNGSGYNNIAHVEVGSALTLIGESLSRKTANSGEHPSIEHGDLPFRLSR